MIAFTDFPIRGIDVSEFNGAIDWTKVRADFCAIRAGHGRVADKRFTVNWAGAKGKVFRFPYWYMDYYSHRDQTTTAYGISDTDWGKIQAEKCWSLYGSDASGMVFLDIESASVADEKVEAVWERVEVIARSYLERMDQLNGQLNGIYCSLSLTSKFSAWFRNRPLWVAWYNEAQTPETVLAAVKARGWTGKVLMWQYASHGDVNGDGAADGQSMGMENKFLDLNAWIAGETLWKSWLIPGGNSQDAPQSGAPGGNMLLNIPPLWQRDPRWANIKMGASNITIGGEGCLITCQTMRCRYFGIDMDPAKMNAWLKANNGYQNGNWFVWSSLKNLDKRISFGYRYERAALDKIDEQLAKGLPVDIEVDYKPGTPEIDQHWVLVVGKVDGSYIINDPWYGTQFKFEEKYGSPSKGVYVVCTHNFAGTPAPLPSLNIPEGEPLYKVKVLIDNLLIRSGAGASYPVVHRYATGVYDVFEEQNGYGRIGVGRWISLNPAYVERVQPTSEDGFELTIGEKVDLMWKWYIDEH